LKFSNHLFILFNKKKMKFSSIYFYSNKKRNFQTFYFTQLNFLFNFLSKFFFFKNLLDFILRIIFKLIFTSFLSCKTFISSMEVNWSS
jgi:hypothetical protein